MSDSNIGVGSWANETENLKSDAIDSKIGSETNTDALGVSDLRHRLRRSRDGNEKDDHSSFPHGDLRFKSDQGSPLKSPTRPYRHRNAQSNNTSRPNYTREKNGLSPLRSPLNAEPRSSRVNPRRRSARNGERNRKENEVPKESSPSKRNRATRSSPQGTLSMDVEDQKFRRRLDLPTEKESGSDDESSGLLDPEIEQERITIERREKQISYGKRNESYQLYIKSIPRSERCEDRKKHPRTPLKNSRTSRRNWDAQVKAWKKYVHHWANINFPTMSRTSRPLTNESESESSSIQGQVEAVKDEEEDNSLDLNAEEDDESFLDDLEVDFELVENQAEPNSASLT